MSTREHTKAELEALLDSGHTVPDLLAMLSEICHEKAEWVASPESIGQPDKAMAKDWTRCARELDRVAMRISGWHMSI